MPPHIAKPHTDDLSHMDGSADPRRAISPGEPGRSLGEQPEPYVKPVSSPLAPLGPKPMPEIHFPDDPLPSSSGRRILDVAVAASMLVAAAPVLGVAALMVRVIDGSPVFYRGTRLGRGARAFPLVKIRTLKTDAESRIGGQLLTDSHDLKTRTGGFLRETRLDELPQLMHVIRGDMNLFGPRPERPEVYHQKCSTIPHYADRFLVRPGVFGYSQILTPHGTPKRVRAVIDRQFVHSPRSSAFDLALLGLTIGSLLKETGVRISRFGKSKWDQRIRGIYREQRKERRVAPPVPTTVARESYADARTLELRDLTTTSFCARSQGEVDVSAGSIVTLVIQQPGTGVVRRARVEILSSNARVSSEGGAVVAKYRPCSENSQYVIEQYLLNKSIVQLPERMRRHKRHLQPST
ncbi:Putative undecaprenyl-phosphate N-acetylgalactosaminyl 1-phosphate transferase [Planctomycetes bacterium Poly30]|uniref:Undecaprenyl-phosphate N-acetylgalactosaminyl 1-phosphate transferase n=1 Tax=Saltatorellus ferox TaxID=2528018 RepID=A0A518EM88_9BACT|nr:Putative undecaprenyl-phosphate N-acetylgalactosaminyl 1-phosphate transferase [Planctomycetes bacterium Poly30]